MAKKLYVGGIPFSSNEDSLRAHFEAAGPVEAVLIITDKMSGRSKGFGFVTMVNDADGQKAIDMFHGKPFDGRNLTVSEARPQAPRDNR